MNKQKNEKIDEKILKNRIREELDKYEKIRKIIFTTYDFDTEFFENQLLPYLFHNHNNLEYEKGEFKTAYELQEKWKKREQKDKTFLIDVYYDHLVGDKQKYVHYNAYKVALEKGIFHPKLIIILGKRKNNDGKFEDYISVIVLSGNITAKSYGDNLEVIGILERKNRINIKDYEQPKEKLRKILNKISLLFCEKILITGEFTKSKNIIDKLKEVKDIKIITPFLSKDILVYLENKKVEVIFTNIMGMAKETKEYLKEKIDNNHKFFINKNADEEKRKIHAKIYILDNNEVIIGSHNFTKASINGNNAEASIVINDEKIVESFLNYYKKLKKEYKDEIDINVLDNEEIIKVIKENERQKNEIEIINANINWNENRIEIYLNKTDIVNKIKINNISMTKLKKEIVLEKENEAFIYNFNSNLEVTNLLHSNKYFEVSIEKTNNKEEILEGFFNEIIENSDELIKNDKAMISDNYLDLLEFDISKKENLKLNHLFYESEDELEELKEDEKEKNKEDLVRMFLAYKNINSEIDSISKNKDKNGKLNIEKRYFTDVNSIINIIKSFLDYLEKSDKLEKKNDNDILYYLLTANELTMLIDKYKSLNQEIKNKEENYREIKKIIRKLENKKEELKNYAIDIICKEKKVENKEDKDKIKKEINIYLKQFGEIGND